MKQATMILLSFLTLFSASAQDALIPYRGKKMVVKIIDVTPNEIRYRTYRHHKVSRETESIPLSEISMIRYKGGRTEYFDERKSQVSQSEMSPQQQQQPAPTSSPVVTVYNNVEANSTQDRLYLHNGNTISGKILKVSEFTISFIYANETAEQIIGKYAVQKVVYSGSNRTENISDKITVFGKSDWEKVVIVENISLISGLTKVGEVLGSTKGWSSMNDYRADKRATRKLKQSAADRGCPYVLITNATNSESISGSYVSGSIFGSGFVGSSSNATYRGIGFKY